MSISNWCRGLSSNLLMDIRLSGNLLINVGLSGDFLMDIRLSLNLDINIRLSSNFLMHIFFSGDLDINVWLSKGGQVSVCYGRIISSGINSSNWGSYSGYRRSSSVSISSRVSIPSSWDNSSTCRGHTGKD